MKFNKLGIAMVVSSLSISVLGAVSFADGIDGAGAAKMLKENKCVKCHSFKAFGIAAPEEKSKAPDLSKLTDATMKEADPVAWVQDWVNKKVERKEKKHRAKFKGTEDDLKALATFLVENTKKK